MDITIVIAGLLFAMFYTVNRSLKEGNTDNTNMPENWPQMPLPEEIADEFGEMAEQSVPAHTKPKQSIKKESSRTAKVAAKPVRGRLENHHTGTGCAEDSNLISHELRTPQGARKAFIFNEILKRKYI